MKVKNARIVWTSSRIFFNFNEENKELKGRLLAVKPNDEGEVIAYFYDESENICYMVNCPAELKMALDLMQIGKVYYIEYLGDKKLNRKVRVKQFNVYEIMSE